MILIPMKTLFFLLLFFVVHDSNEISPYEQNLFNGLAETDKILKVLGDRWEIEKYPLFLKSVAMSSSGWDILRYIYVDLMS